MELLKKFWNEEEGQDLIEYGLLLGFITLAVVTALGTIRNQLSTIYSSTASAVTSAS